MNRKFSKILASVAGIALVAAMIPMTAMASSDSYDYTSSDPVNSTPVSSECTVTFNSNGGSSIEPQTVTNGDKATKPADPTYQGYVFKGWYNGDTLYDFSTSVTGNVTLKAKWNELCTVRLVIYRNGNTSESYKTVSLGQVEKGTKIASTPDINSYYSSTHGFKFEGWLDDGGWNKYKKTGAVKAINFDTYTVNGWTNLSCMVTDYQKVQYFLTEEDRANNKVYKSDKAPINGSVTAPTETPVREGYTFNYWYKEGQKSKDYFTSDQTVNGWTILIGNWTINKYDVKFDSNGGSAVDPQKVEWNKTATKPADPTREGYVFKGWYNGDTLYDFSTPVTGNVTLKAKWNSLETVAVVIYRNGNTTEPYKTVYLDKAEKGSKLTAPVLDDYYTSLFGYEMDGWFNDGGWNTYKATGKVNEIDFDKLTVNGWTNIICMVNDYQAVEYYLTQEDRDNRKVYATEYVLINGSVTAPTETPVREGYTFQYWYKEGQSGTNYFTSGQTVNGWTILIGSWKQNAPAQPTNDQILSVLKTITLDCDDCWRVKTAAITADDIVSIGEVTLEDGKYVVTVTISGNAALAKHYWCLHKIAFTNADTATVKLTWQDGAWVAESDTIVMAVKHAVIHKVIFLGNGGTIVLDQKVADGNTVAQPADPSRLGYTFDGWYTTDGEEFDFSTPITDDITIVAHWKKTSIWDSIASWFSK